MKKILFSLLAAMSLLTIAPQTANAGNGCNLTYEIGQSANGVCVWIYNQSGQMVAYGYMSEGTGRGGGVVSVNGRTRSSGSNLSMHITTYAALDSGCFYPMMQEFDSRALFSLDEDAFE